MDNSENRVIEYSAQLLTYPPSTVVDFVLGTLDATVTECLEVMEESLMKSSTLEGVPKEHLKEGLDQLKSRFARKFEPISNKLERFMLETIFRVPDHVLLPEDAAQRIKHSSKGHKKLLREIENIKAEIQTEKYKKAVFKGKLKEATETLENLKSTATEIETTSQQVFQDNKIANILENAEFIVKQTEMCRAQLNGLHELIPVPETTDPRKEIRRQEEYLCKLLKPH